MRYSDHGAYVASVLSRGLALLRRHRWLPAFAALLAGALILTSTAKWHP